MSSAAQSPRDTEDPAQSASPREETEDTAADNTVAPEDETGLMNAPDIYPDFEVKEQDRWLPIANGKSSAPCIVPSVSMAPCRRCPCHPVTLSYDAL